MADSRSCSSHSGVDSASRWCAHAKATILRIPAGNQPIGKQGPSNHGNPAASADDQRAASRWQHPRCSAGHDAVRDRQRHLAAAGRRGGGRADQAAGRARHQPARGRRPTTRRQTPPRPCTTRRRPAAEKIVDLSTPLTKDVALWLLKEQDEAVAQGRAPLRRARHGDRDPRALSRNQARPRPRHRQRLLLRRLPRRRPSPSTTWPRSKPAWRRSSRATSPSSARSEPREQGLADYDDTGRVHEGPLHRALHAARR